MISANDLATGFSSFWRELTPNSERVVRRLNLSVDRYCGVLEGKSIPARHALINETGFELAKEVSTSAWPPENLSLERVPDETYVIVRDRLSQLVGVAGEDLARLSGDEEGEALEICDRIIYFFANVVQSQPEFFPRFPGCGFLYSSEGDIRTETILFGIKSGRRPFRSPDLRQLIVYSAANFAAKGKVVRNVGLLNPRMGTYFIWDLQAVCFELGGLSPQEIFEQIIFHVSSGGMSR